MSNSMPLEPPFNKFLGFQVDEWSDGHARVSVALKPEHTNSHGIPHGGFLCTLLDVASSLPGIYCPHPERVRRALTLSLNTSFVGVAQTTQLYAVGRVTSAGYKIFHSAAAVYDTNDTLLATAQAVLKYRSGSEQPDGIPLDEWQTLSGAQQG